MKKETKSARSERRETPIASGNVLPAGVRYFLHIDESALAENEERKRASASPRRLQPAALVVSESGEVHRAARVRISGEVTLAKATPMFTQAFRELRGAKWLAVTTGAVELLDGSESE